MSEFTFKYKGQKITVKVSPHIVAMYRADGSMVKKANVDYYYDKKRGYGCETERDVAGRHYTLFCHLV